MTHFRSQTCNGVPCSICQRQGKRSAAFHKVGEEIPPDATFGGHNLTQYVCCRHFCEIMGPAAINWRGCPEGSAVHKPDGTL